MARQKGLRLASVALRSYHNKFLTDATADIQATAKTMGIRTSGTIPLPTKTVRITMNSAPFVFSKAKEQFQQQTHKRLIEFYGDSTTGQDATSVVHFMRYLEHNILRRHPACGGRVMLYSDEMLLPEDVPSALPGVDATATEFVRPLR